MSWQLLIMHTQGDHLLPGELAGGKSGKNLRYTLPSVRGDLIRYVSGKEEDCHNIGLLSEISDQMILKLKDLVSHPPLPHHSRRAFHPAARERIGAAWLPWRTRVGAGQLWRVGAVHEVHEENGLDSSSQSVLN
jgi:hypothetical protein